MITFNKIVEMRYTSLTTSWLDIYWNWTFHLSNPRSWYGDSVHKYVSSFEQLGALCKYYRSIDTGHKSCTMSKYDQLYWISQFLVVQWKYWLCAESGWQWLGFRPFEEMYSICCSHFYALQFKALEALNIRQSDTLEQISSVLACWGTEKHRPWNCIWRCCCVTLWRKGLKDKGSLDI